MSKKITVVAAAVNQEELTLYRPDGSTEIIPQGDPRVRKILEQIQPAILRGEQVEVDLADLQENHYKEVEKQTNGLIRFFKVARTKIKSFFETQNDQVTPIPNGTFGVLPKPEDVTAAPVPTQEQKLTAAIDTIISTAKPAMSREDIKSDEMVVAVVETKEGPKLIPEAQNLKGQVTHSSLHKSAKGLQAFMERISKIIGERRHSVEDLLKFMEKGDLPIADDGCIIIYKVLNRHNDGSYRDVHSGNVKQKIGSYVFMAPEMVDPNRRNECSNGLHVARRKYIGSFPGTNCVIAKVKPEDVIAVPDYDANKMRVCGYHIIEELTPEEHNLLSKNRPITECETGRLRLARIVAGDHPTHNETVEITGHKGAGLKINSVAAIKQSVNIVKTEVTAIDPEAPEKSAPVVDPKQVAATVAETKVVLNGPKHKIRALIEKNDWAPATADEIVSIKKAAKKSWEALGVTPNELKKIEKFASKK